MKKFLPIAAGTIAVAMFGCNSSQFEGYTKAENGLYYKIYNHDENGAKAKAGDKLTVRYLITKQSNDSVVLNSKQNSSDRDGYTFFGFEKPSFNGSFEDGLMMMAKGDSASFIVPADSFFLKSMGAKELPKGFKPGEYLKATFVLKDIMGATEVQAERKQEMEMREAEMKKAEAEEKPAMEKFIAENNIKVKPTPSGLYYIETKKGSGPNPKATDVVKVHYTGKFLDGKIFDSSVERGEPIEFPLNRVIQGWTEGLMLMRKGGKAQLLIPSVIAYGPRGNQGIPPYSPLVFEVELLDFKPAPEPSAQAMPQMPGQK